MYGKGQHEINILNRQLEDKEAQINFLEQQRDFLSARLQIIANLYPSEEDEATDIADKALDASSKMEDAFSKAQVEAWVLRDAEMDNKYFGG